MAYMRSSLKRYGRPALRGFGDGPVTSPDQDPTTGEIQMPELYVGGGTPPFDPNQSTTVATVGPTIIPGPTAPDTTLIDQFKAWWAGVTAGQAASAAVPTTASASAAGSGVDTTTLLWVGGALAAGYYLFGRKKTKRS